ncbi:MAG: PorV/PorQ family protein [Candidatus Marinimicrobia bacterium]|nr:PorV/PorQ family protein [Candidatus Neomarinimicrobiota bacterium]
MLLNKRVIVLLICAATLFGQSGIDPVDIERAGQSGWQFLKINADPRQAAMGGVLLVNNAPNANAAFGSPAILAHVQGIDMQFNSMNWLADIKHSSVAVARQFGKYGTFGLSYITLDYGDIPETIHEDRQGGTTAPVITGEYFSGSDLALGLSYAKLITDRLALGGNVRYIKEEIAGIGMSNWAIDFSTLYYTGINSLRLSIAAKNFGSDTHLVSYNEELQSEPIDIRMPLEFRTAVAYDFFALDDDDSYLTVVLEGKVQSDGSEKINVGTEYVFRDLVFIRGGYRLNYDTEGLTFGLGVNYSLGAYSLSINYAYLDYGVLNQVNMFSLGFVF